MTEFLGPGRDVGPALPADVPAVSALSTTDLDRGPVEINAHSRT